MKSGEEILHEMKWELAHKIKKDIENILENYKEPCLALKMSIGLNANINVVHYSGNGRKSNSPATIAESGVGFTLSGVENWND